jgi:hypothetical protein
MPHMKNFIWMHFWEWAQNGSDFNSSSLLQLGGTEFWQKICVWLGWTMSLLTILWPYKWRKPQDQILFDTVFYRENVLVAELHILGEDIYTVNHIQDILQTEARHYYIWKIDQWKPIFSHITTWWLNFSVLKQNHNKQRHALCWEGRHLNNTCRIWETMM